MTNSFPKQTLETVLDGLMRRYKQRVPDVDKILNKMIDVGMVQTFEEIENDHIAFRTMGVPQLGIRSFEKIWLALGYERQDFYQFDQKKLDAYWYSPPTEKYPRIFISELRVPDLSEEAQAIIRSYTGEVTSDPVDALDLSDGAAIDAFLHQPLWRTPTWSDYQRLQDETEYGSWVIYNRYYLNHFTISVHNLPDQFATIARFNPFLEDTVGVALNTAGGKEKVSGDGLLIQSSTVAEMVEAQFADGDTHKISGSYVEFAERKVLPQFRDLPAEKIERHHRRDGFETSNADKIFESTFSDQTHRDDAD